MSCRVKRLKCLNESQHVTDTREPVCGELQTAELISAWGQKKQDSDTESLGDVDDKEQPCNNHFR